MSKFLGPIHHWLHHKITFQESIEKSVETTLANAGYDLTLAAVWDQSHGEPKPEESLEAVIDPSNIHGWLQRRIGFAETRFAGKIQALSTAHGPVVLEAATKVYALEAESAAKAYLEAGHWDGSLAGAHKLLNNLVLEGMPCDQAGAVTLNEADAFAWQSNRCLHAPYWQAVNGDVAHHYQLRDTFSEAFFKTFGIEYKHQAENGIHQYQLSR